MITMRKVFWQGLGLFACASVSLAGDPVPVGMIVERPESYHAYTVTLEGTARDVQPIGPYVMMDCGNVYDSYKFMLDDGTGSIEVTVPGPCEKPPGTMPPVGEGKKVTAQVIINVLRSDRLPPPVVGTASTIRQLD